MDVVNNPEDPGAGTRKVPFSKVLYIEQEDFQEVPPPKYYRLYPGNEVRLRAAYVIKCTGVVKDEKGNVIEVHATYDPATRGGDTPDGRKIKSTLHWVSAAHAIPAEVRLYDRVQPTRSKQAKKFLGCLNPIRSRWKGCRRAVGRNAARRALQFERQAISRRTESTSADLQPRGRARDTGQDQQKQITNGLTNEKRRPASRPPF
jgi:hypothetical protein